MLERQSLQVVEKGLTKTKSSQKQIRLFKGSTTTFNRRTQ